MNQTKQNPVKIAIHKLGGPTKASNQLSVSNASVHAWINNGTIPDIDIARKVAALTGIRLGGFKFKVQLLQKNLSGELRYYQYDLNDQVKGAQMGNYKQLTSELRYQIYGLKQAGLNQTLIACQIGVNKSTISREFKRNEGIRG